jgi:mRNA m6A methyltransferase catalytic subunit
MSVEVDTNLSKLKIVATTALHALFSSRKVTAPITSKDLLVRVITFRLPDGLFPEKLPPPRFRLTDLSRFEAILEDLSHDWDKADLSITRENGELMVMDVTLPTTINESGHESINLRKRKRIVDEEADSAAGDEPDEPLEVSSTQRSALAGLTKEQREAYAVIQRETAKGRLLAEQVRISLYMFITTTLRALTVSLTRRSI